MHMHPYALGITISFGCQFISWFPSSLLQNMWCSTYTESQYSDSTEHVRCNLLCDSDILNCRIRRYQPRYLAQSGLHAAHDLYRICLYTNTGMQN